MNENPESWANDPSKCPCVVNEFPTPPCDDRCFHYSSDQRSSFCTNCGQASPSTNRQLESPEQVLAYNTDGRTRLGPWRWQKHGAIYECIDGPHKGTFAHPDRLEVVDESRGERRWT